MIHFRQPDQDIGYIILCQVFIALGGGALVICEQIAAMAATSHQYVAVVLAVERMFSYIGGAIGQTVASAIWTGLFPAKLRELLPPATRGDYLSIYGDLTAQLSYPVGSPTRVAIVDAYGVSLSARLILRRSIANQMSSELVRTEIHAHRIDDGLDHRRCGCDRVEGHRCEKLQAGEGPCVVEACMLSQETIAGIQAALFLPRVRTINGVIIL